MAPVCSQCKQAISSLPITDTVLHLYREKYIEIRGAEG
jgi:hypothetical protein